MYLGVELRATEEAAGIRKVLRTYVDGLGPLPRFGQTKSCANVVESMEPLLVQREIIKSSAYDLRSMQRGTT